MQFLLLYVFFIRDRDGNVAHSHPPIRFSTKINHFIPLTPKPIAFRPNCVNLLLLVGDLAQFNNK